DSRPAHARREPGDPSAYRDRLRDDDGPPGFAAEADDHPVLSQSERPGDHPHQDPARPWREDAGASQAARAGGEGQGSPHDLRDDVPARYARDGDALLAGVGRYQSGP